jgi:hypothetical protein
MPLVTVHLHNGFRLTEPHTSRVICEAIKINLHNNFNREGGYQISPAWKIIIHVLKEETGHHSHNQTMKPFSGPVTAASTP